MNSRYFANSTFAPKNSSSTVPPCESAGGSLTSSGGCLCQPGYTSSYDAYETLLFCTIHTEYSPNNSTMNSSGSDSGNTQVIYAVSLSGIIQCVVVFGLCMFVVCGCRGLWTSCCKKDKFTPLSPSFPYVY